VLRSNVAEISQLAASVVDGDLHRQLLDRVNYTPEPYARIEAAGSIPFGEPRHLFSLHALRDRASYFRRISIKTGEQTNRNLHVLAIVTTFPARVSDCEHLRHECRWPPARRRPARVLMVDGAPRRSDGVVLWLLKRSGVLRR
jgi:hypothetical protein